MIAEMFSERLVARQYEVDVTVSDTIIVDAATVDEAMTVAYGRGYVHVTDVREIPGEAESA